MYNGSCLCGAVKYQILSEPKKVAHCHCTMCQKQHGAAFATYASVKKEDLVYVQGEEYLKSFNSSDTIERKFCGQCGSSLEWGGSPDYAEWVSIAIGTLDSPYEPEKIDNLFKKNRVCWIGEVNE
ncbi:MAG: GFA family protein [Endozoicomonas sp.]|uniref:GFA family protein n=1 Tax=Endozoicomonas sp. TaxID=1892382 RepID=UPI003D9B3EA7